MHVHALILAAAALFFSFVFGAPGSLEQRAATVASTRCYTELTTHRGPYSTKWTTSTNHCTRFTTKTTTVTTNLPKSTSTVVETSTTTVTATTSTLTETSVISTTTTETSTATETSTSTSVVEAVSTSTSSSYAGFLPIHTTLPDSSYSGSGGPGQAARRDLSLVKRVISPVKGDGKQQYPKGVSCHKWIDSCTTKTRTSTTTKTLTPKPTTITSITTVATTVYPSATTTITISTTITTDVETTITSTATTTSTSFTSSTTVYEACATNNFADTVGGDIIGRGNIVTGARDDSIFTNGITAYDCCVAAFEYGPNIQTFFSYFGNCLLVPDASATCPAGELSSTWNAVLGQQGFNQITIGNVYCGEFVTSSTS